MSLLSSGSRTGGDDHVSGLAGAEAVVKALVGTFVCFDQEAGHEREPPLIEVALGLLETDEGLAVVMVDQSQNRTGLVYAFAFRPGNSVLVVKSVFEVHNSLLYSGELLCNSESSETTIYSRNKGVRHREETVNEFPKMCLKSAFH